MYLHIGSGKNIVKEEIVGIFDIDTATVSSVSRSFIRKKERDKKIEYQDSDIPRSFIICSREEKTTLLGRERLRNKKKDKRNHKENVYLSRISSTALRARAMSESYYDYDVTEENN